MSWTINLVDKWGERTDLSTNLGFMERVFNLCPTWRQIWKEHTHFTNDGEVIPLVMIKEKIPQIKIEMEKISENADGRSNDGIKEYLLSVIRLIEKFDDGEGLRHKGLAIW